SRRTQRCRERLSCHSARRASTARSRGRTARSRGRRGRSRRGCSAHCLGVPTGRAVSPSSTPSTSRSIARRTRSARCSSSGNGTGTGRSARSSCAALARTGCTSTSRRAPTAASAGSARAVKMYSNRYRIVVRLRAHKLQLWRKRHLVTTYPVAVGTPSTPTPRGLYYIVELLQPSDPGGSYGPYSFGLSAHSNVLETFAGGDGRVGLHGTNEPGLIGSSVSHGCIRLRNAAVRRLAHMLPLGTPVLVRT